MDHIGEARFERKAVVEFGELVKFGAALQFGVEVSVLDGKADEPGSKREGIGFVFSWLGSGVKGSLDQSKLLDRKSVV